jgi:uncharacterized membrane protein
MNTENVTIYVVLVLCLGAVLIMTKDRVPPKFKRGMALTAVIMILFAFIFVIYSLLA